METLLAVFQDIQTAERARQALIAAGFPECDVQVASSGTFVTSQGENEDEHAGGGIAGWFRSVFGTDTDDSGYYANAVGRGQAALSVQSPEARVEEAVSYLNQYGALEVDSEDIGTGVATGSVQPGYLKAREVGESETIPIVEEQLAVGKRAVTRGGVRIISRVTERPVEEDVVLRSETVHVERRPVNRPATEADFAVASSAGSIELTELHEEAVVAKDARVVEEVIVGKDVVNTTETIRDTVRRTDVVVEDIDDEKVRTQTH